ncbi:hypothetical protein [Acetobacter sp. UBA5411]|uniref:hypothetical protein n=1 Tax=Acetobacter sp. UBA5411 TaxID=1945905 RepID=UPI0025C60346|nr:hypothetical protein [Acetobacter sp. UBA5411]
MKQPSAGTDTTVYVKKAISEMETHIPETWNKFLEVYHHNIKVPDEEEEQLYDEVWRFLKTNDLNKEFRVGSFIAYILSYVDSN